MIPVDIRPLRHVFGRQARDRRAEALDPASAGAEAALETFYYAFNQRSPEAFESVWAEDPLVRLANPLGGLLSGREPIRELYRAIFEGSARVWVELSDGVAYGTSGATVFSGRERGEFTRDGETTPLEIRTTRAFAYLGPGAGWRQVHHHGSIDDPELLARYRRAVRGGRHGG